MAEIHVGDIGTLFKFTILESNVALDVSGATTKTVRFTKPDESTLDKTLSYFTDGSDGIVTYKTISGDLDQGGTWKVQATVKLVTGEWHSTIQRFKVFENL